jgi:hypothetical protein
LLFALSHPLRTLAFLLSFHGNPFGAGAAGWRFVALGMGLLFTAGTAVVGVALWNRRLWPGAPGLRRQALALLLVVHGVALLMAASRASLGPGGAMASRYTPVMVMGWLVLLSAAVPLFQGRRAVRRVEILALAVLVLGVGVSAGKLRRLVTWKLPQHAAAVACLRRALADPTLVPAERACLQTLYPDPQRLLSIARRLPAGWGGLGEGPVAARDE